MVDKACFHFHMFSQHPLPKPLTQITGLAACLILSGCQPDQPAAEEKNPPAEAKTEAQVRAFLQEQAKLLNKKHSLTKQLNRLVSTSKIDSSGEMKIVFEEKQQALIDLKTIRDTHPNLQKLNQDLKSWQGHQRSAILNKRESEITQARENILKITGKIHTLSKELPAIREAEDRIARSEKELANLRRSLAEKTPEGKALMDEIQKINEQIAAMQ